MTTNDKDDNLFNELTLEDKLNRDLIDDVENEIDELSDVAAAVEEAEEEVQSAKKHGYLSEEDYKKKYGSLDGFKKPSEFNKFGKQWTEVSDVLKGLQKQVEDRDKQLEAVIKYQERTQERANNQARLELAQQLQQAKNAGNVAAVEQISREQAKVEFQANMEATQRLEEDRSNVTAQFQARNKLALANPEVLAYAQVVDAKVREEAKLNNVPLSYAQLANAVEAHLKVKFPDIMISANAGNNAPDLNSASSNVNKTASTGQDAGRVFNGLSGEHQAVFKATNRMLEKMGRKPYTQQEFIGKLKKEGEI